MAARDEILRRLRMAAARLPRLEVTPLPPAPRRSASDLLRRFRLEAEALGVACHVEETADGVLARAAALLEGLHLLSWDPQCLPYGAGALAGAATFGRAPRADQARADVGLTGCDAAIAETGSLVLLSGPGRSRTVSLLPPLHVALVAREQIVYSLGDFFAANRARLRHSASCTVITGPSRTADIELTLTLGIHGPARVIVIVGP